MAFYDDECYPQSRRCKAGLPNESNLSLPFLAYGVFKPNQLAYSQIKKFVYNNKSVKINYKLSNINGMPVLLNKPNSNGVDANIITFKNDKEKKAYNTIGCSKDMYIYSWEVINVDGQDVNVLMYAGDKEFPGSHFNVSCYDWREDHIFKNILEYLDFNIRRFKTHPFQYQWDDLKPLMEIQSSYMALWAAIDRFLTFRYGNTQINNVLKLSDESFFKDSLIENYDAIDKGFYGGIPSWSDKIFSAQHLKNYPLTPHRPVCAALYYYTLRNNVVHSGKVMHEEIDTVWNALVGLTEIFKDVLEAVKNE